MFASFNYAISDVALLNYGTVYYSIDNLCFLQEFLEEEERLHLLA